MEDDPTLPIQPECQRVLHHFLPLYVADTSTHPIYIAQQRTQENTAKGIIQHSNSPLINSVQEYQQSQQSMRCGQLLTITTHEMGTGRRDSSQYFSPNRQCINRRPILSLESISLHLINLAYLSPSLFLPFFSLFFSLFLPFFTLFSR